MLLYAATLVTRGTFLKHYAQALVKLCVEDEASVVRTVTARGALWVM